MRGAAAVVVVEGSEADTPRPLSDRFRRRRGWLQMNASVLFRRTDNGGDEGRGGGETRLSGSRWSDSRDQEAAEAARPSKRVQPGSQLSVGGGGPVLTYLPLASR